MKVKNFLLLNVAILVAIVGIMVFGLTAHYPEMTKCLSDHSTAKIPKGLKDTRTKAILTFQLYMLLSTLWNRILCTNKKSSNSNANTNKGEREFAPRWSMAIMWYQTWYYAIAYLRELEGEYTCSLTNTKAYGISGHSYCYMYTSILVLTSSIYKEDESRSSSLKKFIGKFMRCALWVLKIAHPVFSAIVVYDTINLGFHTLKQVFAGMYFSSTALLLLGAVESEDGNSIVRPIVHSGIGYVSYVLLAKLNVYPVKKVDIYLYVVAMTLQIVESCWSRLKSFDGKKEKRD